MPVVLIVGMCDGGGGSGNCFLVSALSPESKFCAASTTSLEWPAAVRAHPDQTSVHWFIKITWIPVISSFIFHQRCRFSTFTGVSYLTLFFKFLGKSFCPAAWNAGYNMKATQQTDSECGFELNGSEFSSFTSWWLSKLFHLYGLSCCCRRLPKYEVGTIVATAS